MHQEPLVASAWASTILNYAAQCQLPIDELCARVGLSAEVLHDHSQLIPAQQVLQLFDECAAIGASDQFGCGLRVGLSSTYLQGLNILLDSAATLGDSLQCLVECLPSLMGHIQPEITQQDGFSRVTFNASLAPHAFGLDSCVLALVRNMSRRVGLSPAEVFVEAQITEQQHCGQLLHSWGIPYRHASTLSLLLPSAVLALPLQGANEFLYQALRATHKPSRPPEAKRAPNQQLHLARQWLRSSDQPIESIATRIGYSQASNFIRAFRKQYGITPKQFRQAEG
ncbi:AraC family transcriptional regulator [Pseudomonas cavernae]|uniref:AraC family transcriptional regulator n=1 Tax=Pseudomonas cavernae TaxID=2320867 RepID=A0A385Z1I9_9PSED|nr:AraC family transcriptional regulator [Pseudomonas cavernae]AYC33065.1 AraC family transcriptional regulator [Pseudomonas cavernae]